MVLIQTTKGEFDTALLKKQTGASENERDSASHVEFWSGGNPACNHVHDFDDPTRMCTKKCGAELVHRSVTTTMRKGVAASGVAAKFK